MVFMYQPFAKENQISGKSPDWIDELQWRLLTFVSGLAGLLFAIGLGLFQWALIWAEKHPSEEGGILIDWDPYPKLLGMALSSWVPFSVLICGVSAYLATQRKRSGFLIAGWCLHAVSAIGLVSLGWWVFKVALPGERSGVWWMW